MLHKKQWDEELKCEMKRLINVQWTDVEWRSQEFGLGDELRLPSSCFLSSSPLFILPLPYLYFFPPIPVSPSLRNSPGKI